MPLPAQLLQAVLNTLDKHDGTARKLAAQWYHANNLDARGELVDLQLSLAIRSYNPDINTVALDSQISFLLKKHSKTFLQIDGLAEYVDNYVYHRGFVERITISAENFLKNAPTIFALSPIYHLDLTDVAPVAESLFQSPYLENIVSLSLASNQLEDEHMVYLANSPYLKSLRWLSLMFNKIDIFGAIALAESEFLNNLEYVNFFENIIDPTDYQTVDQGVILEHLATESGEELERRCGHVSWLHSDAVLERDLEPNRFIIG
jgi:Leucine-rich repeat (LRR) protein